MSRDRERWQCQQKNEISASIEDMNSMTTEQLFDYFLLLLLSVGLPVANAPDVLQPYGLLYYP